MNKKKLLKKVDEHQKELAQIVENGTERESSVAKELIEALEDAKKCMHKVDELLKHLYEDNIK